MQLVEKTLLLPDKTTLVAIYRSLLRARQSVWKIAISDTPGRLELAVDKIAKFAQAAIDEVDSPLDLYFMADEEADSGDYEGKKDTAPGVSYGSAEASGKIIVAISYFLLYASSDENDDWKKFCLSVIKTIEHEMIHRRQYALDQRSYSRKSMEDEREKTSTEYFMDPAEIGAFAWGAYRELREHLTPQEILTSNIQMLSDNSEILTVYSQVIGPLAVEEDRRPRQWKRFLRTIYYYASKAKPR